MGQGLFAKSSVMKGCEIIRMQTSKTVTKMERYFLQHLTKYDQPHDCFVEHHKGGKEVSWWDATYEDSTPLWYRMNHGCDGKSSCGCDVRANCKIQADPNGCGLIWVSTRNIQKNEELFWNYGEPDPSWVQHGSERGHARTSPASIRIIRITRIILIIRITTFTSPASSALPTLSASSALSHHPYHPHHPHHLATETQLSACLCVLFSMRY
jgi:hypothetical protein